MGPRALTCPAKGLVPYRELIPRIPAQGYEELLTDREVFKF
jgi:hypothetical protein